MFESRVFNEGMLIVGRISGCVEPQSFINGIFWQIDSRNVGEVKQGFSQLYYEDAVEQVKVTDADVRRMAEFNTGIGVNVGSYRTALVLQHPELIRLARLHQSMAQEYGLEVELFDTLDAGFDWLGVSNPEPTTIVQSKC
jgi:hypothetical protein